VKSKQSATSLVFFLILPLLIFVGLSLSNFLYAQTLPLKAVSIGWKLSADFFPPIERIWKHADSISSVAISPDGSRALIGSDNGTLIIKDLRSWQILESWKHSSGIIQALFSPDGKQVLISIGSMVLLQDISTKRLLHSWHHEDVVNSIAFGPSGELVASGSNDKSFVIRNTKTGATVKAWKADSYVTSLALSATQKWVAIGTENGGLILTSLHPEDNSEVKITFGGFVRKMKFAHDENYLLVGGYFGTAKFIEIPSGHVRQEWPYEGGVSSVDFSPDGSHALIAGGDRTVLIKNLLTGETINTLDHDGSVRSAVFSADGRYVLSGANDGFVRFRGSGLRASIQHSFHRAFNIAEVTHRVLPKPLLLRQTQLESSKPLRDEFESMAQFNARVAQWNKAVEALNADIQLHYSKLGDRKSVV